MKRLFVTAEDYNAIIFADKNGNGYVIDESLTLDVAKNADYSNFDGCETAEDCAASIGTAEAMQNVIPFSPAEYDNITEF